MSLIGALKAAKKTAPFYSAVDEALAAIKRPKGTGAEFYTELTKQAGVKKAELADRKLEQAFKAKGKMTKEEAQQVLKENPPPKLQERQLTEIDDATRERMLDEKLETSGYDYMGEVPARRLAKWNEEIDADMEKYGDYRTPNGRNYREILLKLPKAFSDAESNRLMSLEADLRRGELSTKKMEELVALQTKKKSAQPEYWSPHWLQDENVLAHMRVQDRAGPNGEKVLHVEEIQSDWHQEGRKKGYRNQEAIDKAKLALDEYTKDARERLRQIMLKESESEMAPDRALKFVNQYVDGMDDSAIASFLNEKPTFVDLYRATKGINSTAVPDAPFKKNWHELAMKRLLNYAADNGYDSIAITPGAEQAKRYDLSKQINTISWNKQSDGLYNIEADAVNGRPIIKKGMTEQELENTVGKEVANRIVNGVGQFANDPLFDSGKLTRGKLENLDLQVGGEGMMGFYDKMLPDYLNTFGKPYNAQMGTFSIPGDRGATVERLGVAGRNLSEMTPQEVIDFNKMVDEAGAMKLHNFPITPEMRESIKQKGLPLYQQIGIPTAGAGAASQMPEQMQEQEVEPEVKKAKGGRVRMTTNRDTMFMELSNKKLKRK